MAASNLFSEMKKLKDENKKLVEALENWENFLYLMAAHIANFDGKDVEQYKRQSIDILKPIYTLNPQRFDEEVAKHKTNDEKTKEP